jgi:hypothetical protein
MKLNKLKALWLPICCFVIALCTQNSCLGSHLDDGEITPHQTNTKHSESYVSSLKTDREGSARSWASCLIDPFKTPIQMSRKIIKNSLRSAFVVLILGCQIAPVAADCFCYCYSKYAVGGYSYYGVSPNFDVCNGFCRDVKENRIYGCDNMTMPEQYILDQLAYRK